MCYFVKSEQTETLKEASWLNETNPTDDRKRKNALNKIIDDQTVEKEIEFDSLDVAKKKALELAEDYEMIVEDGKIERIEEADKPLELIVTGTLTKMMIVGRDPVEVILDCKKRFWLVEKLILKTDNEKINLVPLPSEDMALPPIWGN